MNTNSKLLAIAAVALALALAVPATVGQTAAAFGSQVKFGDADFVPTSAATSVPLAAANILEIDLGTPLEVQDNCFVYDSQASATVSNFDVLLNACGGKAAGALIGDADTTLKTGALVASGFVRVAFADVNQNGRYDSGDFVYLTTGTAPNLAASTANGAWTLRLTASGGKAAGTLVAAGDSDLVSYGGAAATQAAEFAFFDANLNTVFDTGDSLYLSRIALAAAGALFPIYSVRLVGGAGAFGSQVKLGDVDFVPTSAAASTTPVAARILEVDLGTPLEVQDNCFIWDPAGGVVSNFDVLLNACGGKAAGSLIGDADTTIKTGALVASGFTRVAFADVNQNGRYDNSDYLYLTTGTAPNLAASTANGAWTLRLTPSGGKAAGTLVAAGDSDLVSYGAAAATQAAEVAFFDANLNTVFDTGDSLYVTRVALGAAGALFPLYSVRLVGGSGAFGTQLKLGDADFTPTFPAAMVVLSASAVPANADTILMVDLGTPLEVQDNCIVYDTSAADNLVSNFDLLLNSCQGKAAGTLIGDGDTVIKTGGVVSATAAAVRVAFADVNQNGRYDLGDFVYLTTGTAPNLAASTANNAWTLRLTASGGKAAGTFVAAGDSDLVSYGGAAANIGAPGVVFFDANLNGVQDTGDSIYLARLAPAGLFLLPIYSVRLSGPIASSGAGTGVTQTNTATSTVTSTSTNTTTSTLTSTLTNTATSTATNTNTGVGTGSETGDGDGDGDNSTPGFELVALVGALAVALVLVRRKL